ncbi:MAG: ATP-binding protein, partial [Acidobacteriota bacterium]|nr:ATP-binding protein [Acidobacteriota bacterium]
MSRADRERQLRWLMTLRVVVVTTLLISAFGIELVLRPAESLRPLFTLTAAAYTMVLLYAVLARVLPGLRLFIRAQLIGDACLVSAFVAITGGIDSPMSFLYLLPITAASLATDRRWAMTMAGVCWLMYGAMVAFPQQLMLLSGILPASDPSRMINFLVAHLVAMVAFAWLSVHLAERIRSQGKELDQRAEAVARLKALNENIIGSINSGLITTNLSGKINFMNRGGAEILGQEFEAVDGQQVEQLFGLEADYLGEVRRQLLANRRFRFEKFFTTGDARHEQIFLGIAASNLHDRTGAPLGFIFIFQDLTEIHALEQEMRLRERMAALGEMAAGMAHELRNPLASISGAVQYLKGIVPPDQETLDLMDIVMRESHRLDQAIRDFLTFARPGAFAPEHVDLVRVIEDGVKLLSKSRESGRSHRIETDYDDERMECVVDANRLKQVFWNLASNGLKAMPDGGELRIGLHWRDERSRIELSIADQGEGMNEEQRASYFQPFSGSFQEGTGLGAAIVYRLVEEHDGKIHLESAPGRGTRVRISLPSRCPAVGPAGSEETLQAVGG